MFCGTYMAGSSPGGAVPVGPLRFRQVVEEHRGLVDDLPVADGALDDGSTLPPLGSAAIGGSTEIDLPVSLRTQGELPPTAPPTGRPRSGEPRRDVGQVVRVAGAQVRQFDRIA